MATNKERITANNELIAEAQEIADSLPSEADVLAAAKESGEFDGADGLSIFPVAAVSDKSTTYDVIASIGDITTNGRDVQVGDFLICGSVLYIVRMVATSTAEADFVIDLKGEPGAPGDDYVLTESDKTEIAGIAAEMVDVPDVDDTLTVSGAAADAQVVGDRFDEVSGKIADLPNDETLIENVAEVVKAEVPLVKVAEQPDIVDSIEEMTDTSKAYVLSSDGYFYKHTTVKETATHTFTADDFVADALNTNGALLGAGTPNRIATEVLVDLSAGAVSIYCPSPYQYIVYYYTARNISNYIGKTSFKTGSITDVLNDTVASGTIDGATFCRISLRDSTDTNADLSGRIDEFMANVIISQTGGTTVETNVWKSTGLAYNQPSDYEDRIVAIENLLNGLETAEDGEW